MLKGDFQMNTPKRGWSSQGLKVVNPDDSSYWSTRDAALLLGDGLKTETVRSLIRLAGIVPAGKRHGPSKRGGRYVRVYAAIDLIKAYEAISDVVGDSDSEIQLHLFVLVDGVPDSYPIVDEFQYRCPGQRFFSRLVQGMRAVAVDGPVPEAPLLLDGPVFFSVWPGQSAHGPHLMDSEIR